MSSAGKLAGKVAVITGSSGGLGAGMAVDFCREGALVVLNGRNEKSLQSVAAECERVAKHGKKPLIIAGDIMTEDVRVRLIEETIKKFGRLDILVNNAGSCQMGYFVDGEDVDKLDFHLTVHVKIPFHITQLAMKHLIKTKGVVINMSSATAFRPLGFPLMSYSVAKAAMDQMTRCIASELGPKGVRVNSICPGYIATDFHRQNGQTEEEEKKVHQRVARIHALQRVGEVSDISRAATFLASNDASYVTGVNMLVDGGSMVMPIGHFV